MTENLTQERGISPEQARAIKKGAERTTESPSHNQRHSNATPDPTKPVKSSAWPTKESIRHDGGILMEVLDRTLNNNVVQLRAKKKITCKLDLYEKIGVIDAGMKQAGYTFAYYYFYAHKSPNVTMSWLPPGARGGKYDHALDNTAAEEELKRSIEALRVHERDAVIHVCGLDQMLLSKNTKILPIALTRLETYYEYSWKK